MILMRLYVLKYYCYSLLTKLTLCVHPTTQSCTALASGENCLQTDGF